ncbi:sirohydrochlorin chelatase [Amorphoplanes nipponensis]|uniref:Cobalamin biosynthesis protein n=1 Tax=Actinoplanes nipponensis TaxID=135950 RepID=A0A919MLU4_9ACTN|nr:CbiX/SirB N-terminal domain-containing protein [Actinoplanes nipponensis]GIE49881.1 cobalamin biosynthesis protein [Actinoplanes nipponensis]
MRPARLAVTLTAHGSRDPRAARATEALTRAVARRRPEWEVRASYLDHAGPRPREVLGAFADAGHRHAVLVPLLLTSAYHGRVDVPGEITAARAEHPALRVEQAGVLGPIDGRVPELLLDALVARLPAATPATPGGGAAPDALVLAAAGTRNADARATVEEAAAALSDRLGMPCRVAYASAAPPLSGDVVRDLRAAGHDRVALVSYFLAPGLLWDSTLASAREAGVFAAGEPMTDASALAELVVARVLEVSARPVVAVAA